MREPIATKTHYPNGITLLDKEFDTLFNGEKGPGALPATKLEYDGDPVKAVIVPHAPYSLCGQAAAWSYKALAEEAGDTDFYLIIAQPQFSSKGGVTQETFLTPYGEVRCDQNFIRELVAKKTIDYNNDAHEKESVIEIQLPFLQFIRKPHIEKVRIVPLLVTEDMDLNKLAVDIKETLIELKKTCTIIVVSNLTSYGRNFHYVPFTEKIAENISEVDKKILGALQQFDKEAFEQALQDTLAPISGLAAIQLMFYLLQPKKVALEQYYLSGDINQNYMNTVSYASLVFR